MMRLLAATGLVIGLTACQTTADLRQPPPPVHLVQQATLWVQTAGEYRASALQAWRAARHSLDRALADPAWTAALEQHGDYASLPPAIIVDADETVIDNSPFEARLVLQGTEFSESGWDRWVAERNAGAVPGAVQFLNDAAARGVTIFYVTNRDHSGEADTLANLVRLGFPIAPGQDVLLTSGENGWNSDKSPRRRHVANRYRIVLMAGDDMNDFLSGTRVAPPERLAIVDRYADWWGERWIVLPNPLYGSWDRALFGYDRDLDEPEKQRRRLEALRP